MLKRKSYSKSYRSSRTMHNLELVIKECNECARAWLKSVAVLVTEEALW